MHGLLSRDEVDDAEPRMRQAGLLLDVHRTLVGSPMPYAFDHQAKNRRVCFYSGRIYDSCDPAHTCVVLREHRFPTIQESLYFWVGKNLIQGLGRWHHARVNTGRSIG